MKRSNIPILILALITIAAWGLVVRQEIKRDVLSPSKGRRLPQSLPPGGTIKLPAPGSGPTEETPAVEIFGTITDAETGQPVVADVQAANVHIDDVTEFRLVFPASDEAITITVTAPGYQKRRPEPVEEWSVDIKPHIKRSKKIDAPIKLQPERRPEPDEGPTHDQA